MNKSCRASATTWNGTFRAHFQIRGKEAFDKHIEGDEFVGSPVITVTRFIEAGDIVIAEGVVETQRKDGPLLKLAFCDLFEMQDRSQRVLVASDQH
jgi:hypothetical protein